MMRTVGLLITCVGGATMTSLLRCLRGSDNFNYILIGVDSVSAGNADDLLDSYYKVPRGNHSEYVEKLLEIALKEKVEFILPGSDEEAISISKKIGMFNNVGIEAIISGIDVLELISNKMETYKLLSNHGIKIPEYEVISSVEELKIALNKYRYPEKTVISKPSNGRGGRGLYVFKGMDTPPSWLGNGKREIRISKDDITDDLLKNVVQGECLVMPMLTTPAYDVDVMAIKGDVEAIVVRKRINPSGIPFQGNKILCDKAIEKYCIEIAKILNLDGLHDIDLMTDNEGNACIIEVNPRPSGSMAASLIAGVPMIDIAILSLLKQKIPSVNIKDDITVLPGNDNTMSVVHEKN
jgi:carbamoyl-phosphate synthase large subunit